MKLKYLVLLAVTGTIISLDQLTKLIVIQKFYLGESVPVINGFFSFTYVRNPGAAFGLLNTWNPVYRVPFFILTPLIALGSILYVFRKIEDHDLVWASALSLVVGGAIGNLIDRVSYQYVIDFLDFHWGMNGPHFPAFNIADAAISVGVAMLVVIIIKNEKKANVPNTV